MSKKTKAVATTVNVVVNRKVFVKLDEAAQVMFNHQRQPNVVSFPAVVATTANMLKTGTLTVPADRIEVKEDVCQVVLSAVDLELVFKAAHEYNTSRPATVETAKQAITYAENAIEFAASNNSGLNLDEAEAKLADAKSQLKAIVFGHGEEKADFGQIVNLAYEAATMAKQAVVGMLKVKAAGIAKETDTLDEFADVLDGLPEDLDAARKSLVEFIKKARQLRPSPRPTTRLAAHTTAAPLRERIGTSLGRIGR